MRLAIYWSCCMKGWMDETELILAGSNFGAERSEGTPRKTVVARVGRRGQSEDEVRNEYQNTGDFSCQESVE